jgi:hypothetical protein
MWRGERRGKFFGDRVHGDRLGMLTAAIEGRNATEIVYYPVAFLGFGGCPTVVGML